MERQTKRQLYVVRYNSDGCCLGKARRRRAHYFHDPAYQRVLVHMIDRELRFYSKCLGAQRASPIGQKKVGLTRSAAVQCCIVFLGYGNKSQVFQNACISSGRPRDTRI